MVKVIPVLQTFDYSKTIEFYIEWLGCEIRWEYQPEDSPFYMQVSIRDAIFDLSEHHGECSPGGRISIVEFDGLKAYHQQLIDKEYKFMRPGLEKAEWPQDTLEMTVIDPFYIRLIFSERL